MIGVHPISVDEYYKWHATGKLAGMIFQVEYDDSVFYAYDFINPRRLARPIKITKTGRVWTAIDDSVVHISTKIILNKNASGFNCLLFSFVHNGPRACILKLMF